MAVQWISERVFGKHESQVIFRLHRIRLWTVLAVLAAGGTAGAFVALAAGRGGMAVGQCPRYVPGQLPRAANCVTVPWLLLESGPDARSLILILAPGCFSRVPTARVSETSKAITIRVIARVPLPNSGHVETSCVYEPRVKLRRPILGRRIRFAAWIKPLRYGLLADHLLGLPRLLGMAPAQAARVLWLEGFRARISGRGREVVAQIPGWGLVAPDGVRPDPFPGRVILSSGGRIMPPSPPQLPPGVPTGVLAGGLVFSGGPAVFGHQRPFEPGVVNVFDDAGRLLAQPHTRAGHRFHLTVQPGRYLLNTDADGIIECRPASALVRAGRTTRVSVGFGCFAG